MSRRVKLDSAGVAEVLRRSEVAAAAGALAEQVADGARGAATVDRNGAEVVVDEYEASGGRMRSARPAFAVTVKHPGALGMEAKYGVLSGAAAAMGLTVRGKR